MPDESQSTVRSEEIRVLHVHGQRLWHDEVTVVGNGQALSALRDLLNAALADGEADGEFTVSDGEGYRLMIKLRPAAFGDAAWNSCALPYSDRMANPPRTDGAQP